MKINFLTIFCCLLLSKAFAQSNPDSVAYENQRVKINDMLAARAAKFNQYDLSLTQHSGIFGMQTKKDIRASNAILMDIVSNDNEILRQTKVLLNLKTNQLNATLYHQQIAQLQAKETVTDVTGYMTTINKLRKQNDLLQNKVAQHDKNLSGMQLKLIIVIILFIITSILLIVRRNRGIKA